MIPDKNLIKLRFEQAAATYEQQATVQHLVADRLLALLAGAAPALAPASLLEIGCCTGLLTEKIATRFPSLTHLTVSDLVASFTLHWVHDLPGLCRKLHAHLTPHALLAFSLYGVENLREIRTVTGMGLRYQDLAQLQAVVAENFTIVTAAQVRETLWFTNPFAVLQHLRDTGVNSVGQQAWTRKQVNEFITAYTRHFSGEQGVCLTYHPMFIIARPNATPI